MGPPWDETIPIPTVPLNVAHSMLVRETGSRAWMDRTWAAMGPIRTVPTSHVRNNSNWQTEKKSTYLHHILCVSSGTNPYRSKKTSIDFINNGTILHKRICIACCHKERCVQSRLGVRTVWTWRGANRVDLGTVPVAVVRICMWCEMYPTRREQLTAFAKKNHVVRSNLGC